MPKTEQGPGGTVRPRVLLDATAVPRDIGGVGRYVLALIAAMPPADVDLIVACQRDAVEELTRRCPGVRFVPIPRAWRSVPMRLVWEQLALPGLARRLGAEVIHSPHYTLPLASSRPVVVTLHDATFFTMPEVHSGVKGRFFRAWTRLALRRAAVIVVPSETTGEEVAAHVGRARGPVVVAAHGVDLVRFHPPEASELTRFRARWGEAAWVAFLGTIEPRKNVPLLVRAFDSVAADPEVEAVAPGLRLLLAGQQGWERGLEEAVAATERPERIVRLGYLPEGELRALLGGAALVAYPSRAEGFGLPVLEAMACGAAVVTTRHGALREIGGEAVVYTEESATGLAELMRALILDRAARADLGARARARAETFTWAASAAAHARAYRRALRLPASGRGGRR